MEKITIKFDPKFNGCSGVINFASWDRLKEYIAPAANLTDEEEISGLVIDERGINIFIKSK